MAQGSRESTVLYKFFITHCDTGLYLVEHQISDFYRPILREELRR